MAETKRMTEDQHQAAVMQWSQQASVRAMYPELKLLYHIPNERKCTPQQGMRLKRLGVKAGVPDLDLPVSRGGHHGLKIEMKAEKGRTSEEQEWWIRELTLQGYMCRVCYGWKDAVNEIVRYLEL